MEQQARAQADERAGVNAGGNDGEQQPEADVEVKDVEVKEAAEQAAEQAIETAVVETTVIETTVVEITVTETATTEIEETTVAEVEVEAAKVEDAAMEEAGGEQEPKVEDAKTDASTPVETAAVAEEEPEVEAKEETAEAEEAQQEQPAEVKEEAAAEPAKDEQGAEGGGDSKPEIAKVEEPQDTDDKMVVDSGNEPKSTTANESQPEPQYDASNAAEESAKEEPSEVKSESTENNVAPQQTETSGISKEEAIAPAPESSDDVNQEPPQSQEANTEAPAQPTTVESSNELPASSTAFPNASGGDFMKPSPTPIRPLHGDPRAVGSQGGMADDVAGGTSIGNGAVNSAGLFDNPASAPSFYATPQDGPPVGPNMVSAPMENAWANQQAGGPEQGMPSAGWQPQSVSPNNQQQMDTASMRPKVGTLWCLHEVGRSSSHDMNAYDNRQIQD